ncbi:MAG: hypothetical protein WCP85_22705 [Mariniphaga sp.]
MKMDRKNLSQDILFKLKTTNFRKSVQAIKILILLSVLLFGFSGCQPDTGTNGTTGATSENTIGGQSPFAPILDWMV